MSAAARMESFSSTEILKLCPSVTYRMLDYWCRTGQLGDEHAEPLGHGYQRRFTTSDLAVIKAGAILSEFGFNRHARRKALQRIRVAVSNGLHIKHPEKSISCAFDGSQADQGEARILIPLSALCPPAADPITQ